ncbi:MAG: hypothetical protein ACHQT7_01510 [Candidatus Levyibacteriota bacterium]
MKGSTKPQSGLLILNRDNFYMYTPGISGFLTLTFPETMIKDLEIVNQEELENQIRQFVESSGIAPAEITIILSSDILFEKEIAGGPEENEDRQKFLDSLPFESVYKIVIPKDQKPHIITVNRELLDGIIQALTKLDFTVVRAVPYEFLRKNSIQTVDVGNAPDIIKRSESMKLYNMLDYKLEKQTAAASDNKNGKEDGESKVRLYLLIGVLVVMGTLLLYLLVRK